jgi:hypothetical protein
MINTRVISRSVTALIDKTPSYRGSTLLRVGLGQVRTGNVQRDGPFDAWAQEESSKPDPKGGDESPWKLQESLVHNSQHAAQQHRRQHDRSDPPGESISGAMSAVKQKETGDHREDGDGNRWPPQVPRNLGSSSYCRCDRADAPKGRNSRPAVGADAIRDLAQAGDGNRKEERCDFEQQKGLSSLGENPCALDQPGDAAEKRP